MCIRDRFGLAQPGCRKGKIQAGFDADMVVWDPDASFVVSASQLFHRHPITPYEGRKLNGVVHQSLVRGEVVYDRQSDAHPDSMFKDRPTGKLMTATPARIAGRLNELDSNARAALLESCCASQFWIARMVSCGEFSSDEDVIRQAEKCWQGLAEADFLEAFLAHPKIGDVDSLRAKYANTKSLAKGEQSGVESAGQATLERLSAANDEYFDKFGFIFIVCATGKSADEMLAILESRLPNDRSKEIEIAAAEQMKIITIRLRKLIQ